MMKGDTLIEVLIALAVAVVVISAITTLGISSLNTVQIIRDQDQSTKYAQEGMEMMRALRNSNYLAFRTLSGKYCLGDEATATTPLGAPTTVCSVNISNRYIRMVTIAQDGGCGANLANTIVTVSWTDNNCAASNKYCHASKLTSCFSTVPPVSEP